MFKTLPTLTYENSIFGRLGNQTRSMYFEDIQDRDTLFISIGDSWTWGDSLYGIRSYGPMLDHPDRTKSVYGALIAKALNADFINCAKCGGSNMFIQNMMLRILEHNQNNYNKIILVMTLTENGREIHEPGSRKWFTGAKNVELFLKNYEQKMFEEFKRACDSFPNVKIVLARNFTHSYDENLSILEKYFVDKNWIDILNSHQEYRPYPNNLRFLTGQAMLPIQETMEWLKIDYKDQMIIEYDKSLAAIDWLDKSNLNHNSTGTKHPIIEGHKYWADYLLTKI